MIDSPHDRNRARPRDDGCPRPRTRHRHKLSLPHEDVALAATGYSRGTITPLGSTTPWPVVADERLRGNRVAMGAGEHGYSAFVDADALIDAYGATVADITDPLKPRA
ncbi:prolyl-tRNA editing enzyme YbaK/EbsC (Cys-tRNA(Pro) deacylase) [Cryobacterium psychrotolerans]|nr:prolyl-tRNA editing enzyme YbaK/EbsC (Cys-tRNA(Pro) deacylase) [Cryobacterium psychrotolerans]